ncbi:hypothetical protein TSMEX_010492 [Taenia solium]|eukprot:TsM_000132900 transcript=TsM_000132900 gene=TsM_000132900
MDVEWFCDNAAISLKEFPFRNTRGQMSVAPIIVNDSTDNFAATATSDVTFVMVNATDLLASSNHVFAGMTSVFLTTYVLIILGFLVGHFRLLSKAQIRGFGRFVHRYAISAILFIMTVTIHLEAIQWPAIWSIFISRLLMFFVSTAACLVISRGQFLGLSAIVSLLLTDSNDIADEENIKALAEMDGTAKRIESQQSKRF